MQSLLELSYQSLLKNWKEKSFRLLTPCYAFMYSTVHYYFFFSFDLVPYRRCIWSCFREGEVLTPHMTLPRTGGTYGAAAAAPGDDASPPA